MITSCLRSKDGRLHLELSLPDIARALADAEALLWIDVAGDEPGEARPLLLETLGVHPLTVDDCYNTLIDPPKIDDYGSYLFVIVHSVQYDPGTLRLATSELDMYIGANYVVTFHRAPLRAIDEVRRRAESHSLVLERGPAFLAHAIFDVVVDDFHPVVEALDEQISSIEEQVLEEPERRVLQQVLALKRNAQRLRRSITPQRDVANRFARGEYRDLIAPDALVYFRDIHDHTVRVEEMIDSIRDLSDSALNTYLSAVNNKTNEVMKTLAIVTVVFLPLTLIAGIYGTNFENVSEYGWRFGYAGMLALMAALSTALVAWFRWRHWF